MDREYKLVLDRMEIEEAGPRPDKLAAAIHRQLGDCDGPVPVHAIARALDIVEIREEPITNLEGALITTAERDVGSILVNCKSGRQRQRYSVGHELGHFLNPWHEQTADDGFQCSRQDMREGNWHMRRGLSRHEVQEVEANRFAIELLAPSRRFERFLASGPDLARVLSAARAFDVSREAAARRYVERHEATVAIAFSRAGRLRYWARCSEFPRPTVNRNDLMPDLPQARSGSPLSDHEEADPIDWLVDPGRREVTVQTLHQQNDFAMSLVVVESQGNDGDDDGDGGVEDAFDRLNRFS